MGHAFEEDTCIAYQESKDLTLLRGKVINQLFAAKTLHALKQKIPKITIAQTPTLTQLWRRLSVHFRNKAVETTVFSILILLVNNKI